MPWKPSDAKSHTKKADTATKQRQWAHVANGELERTGNEGLAIKAANSAVKRHPYKHGDGAGHWSGH